MIDADVVGGRGIADLFVGADDKVDDPHGVVVAAGAMAADDTLDHYLGARAPGSHPALVVAVAHSWLGSVVRAWVAASSD